MKTKHNIRVLWLLNHTTLRKFELDQMINLGITEFFLPKFYPYDEGNLSASIDYSFDAQLTIPASSLAVLNDQNWYKEPSAQAWDIANQYFDIVVIGFFPDQINSTARYFHGQIVLRAFGLANGNNYTTFLYDFIGVHGVDRLNKIKSRLWFGAGYEHLHECEGALLQERNCYLPVGLNKVDIHDQWSGEDKRILFVCPRINTSTYFKNIYQQFIHAFDGFDFTIAGAQPISVNDKRVIGFVLDDNHQYNLKSHRVMFYHSTELNHIHYHPFEAIRMGMPLIFMAGGCLDTMGGIGLWGRCKSIKEAVSKVRRILKDDGNLIHSLKHEQKRLLDKMNPDYCGLHFTKAYEKIIDNISDNIRINAIVQEKKKIAVILPEPYRGGSLRGAICLANSLLNGSNFFGDTIEVVFAHLALPEYEDDNLFLELAPSVKRRAYLWKTLTRDEAIRALCYAGHPDWSAKHQEYDIPDDGINQFLDCDLWIIISDRLNQPLLPIRPHVLMIYDYLQRYIPFLSPQYENILIQRAHEASRVLVTTEFTKKDVLQYAGVKASLVFKVPMLVPEINKKRKLVRYLDCNREQAPNESLFNLQSNKDHLHMGNAEEMLRPYFMWTTNVAKHKNHINVYLALQKYYYELDGLLECHISGAGTDRLAEFYPQLGLIYNSSDKLQEQLTFCGELTDASYINKLRGASFLFHAALVDNGTFCVIEAAKLGVPSLSNNYPPMREINERFNLGLSWMDATNPNDIALQLKKMEETYIILKDELMKKDPNQFQHTLDEEAHYWRVICECL